MPVSSFHADKPLGQCCGVVPIRQGVGVICLFIFLDSLFGFLGFWTDDLRTLTGGYAYSTRVLVGMLGVLGLVMSPVGLLGVYENTAPLVRYFYLYIAFRLGVVVLINIYDFYCLATCEVHAELVHHRDMYNVTLDTIAKAGLCGQTRQLFFWFLLADVLITAYWCSVTNRLSHVLDHPAYLIGFEKRPPGTFTKRRPREPDEALVGNAYTAPRYDSTV